MTISRLLRPLLIATALACLLAFVGVAPPAGADPLPNGYDASCTMNGSQAVCNISGCPRVHEDEAGDVVHVRINGGEQDEIKKGCNSAATTTVGNVGSGFTFSVQGCRKNFGPVSDDCGAWSDYHFTAPAPAAAQTVTCPAGSPVASVPQGQQCPAAPVQQVNCPQGSPTPQAASLGQCAPAPPKNCPDGSVTPTVPAGQQCSAPTNAVAMTISRNLINAIVAVTNNSALFASCDYTATKVSGVGPATVTRGFGVGPHSTSTLNDLLWPPPLTLYNATVVCRSSYNGQQVTIGQASQTVSG